MLLNCSVGEDSWEFLGLHGDPTSPSKRKSVLNIHWKNWCWSWKANILVARWELTHLKRPWCWERLQAGGEGDDRGWDGWMESPIQWTWVWLNSGRWWWTGRPGVLQSLELQRVRNDWVNGQNTSNRLKFERDENCVFLRTQILLKTTGFTKILHWLYILRTITYPLKWESTE